MNVLLIEREPGIREAIAAFLRLRGHRVRTAEGVDEGLESLRAVEFDAVVTDWRLGDDDASAIVASAHGPCVVICDRPDEVVEHPAIAAVLAKPIGPARLAAILADLEGNHDAGPCAGHDCLDSLPLDTRDRVRAVLSILDEPARARVDDDGRFVTIEGRLSETERWVGLLEGIGGDLRVISEGADDADDEAGPLRLLLRLDRSGLPAGVEVAVGPDDRWPEDGAFAIDLHGVAIATDRFLALCDRVRRALRMGRFVELVNVPSHLRICLEAVGRADDLPIRKATGPRLPEVLGQLWR